MKHSILLISFLGISMLLHAQTIKTVNISAGGLSLELSATERYEVTNLTVTGTIDARDFKTMRDSLPHLSAVDLRGSLIVPYSTQGYEGTNISRTIDWNTGDTQDSIVTNYGGGYSFAIEEVPIFALRAHNELSSIVLPFTTRSISDEAFMACGGLTSVTIPENISLIGNRVFRKCTSLKTIIVRSAIPVDLSEKPEVFEGVNKNTCILFVPIGSKEKYEVATGWKDFKKIVETK